MQPTGHPQFFPIIGSPVTGVVSPPSVNEALQKRGVDAIMTPLNIPENTLAAFWSLLRASDTFLGCSVTYPYKQAAFEEVDTRTPRATRLGAVNTIQRDRNGNLAGEATDGLAMVSAIAGSGFNLAGKTARVLGAGGGAGLAIIDAFCDAGIATLILEERDPTRLAHATSMVRAYWPNVSLTSRDQSAEILVNATTLGLEREDALPFSPSDILASALVCDVVGGTRETNLIQHAKASDCVTVNGQLMGAHQAASQLDFVLMRKITESIA